MASPLQQSTAAWAHAEPGFVGRHDLLETFDARLGDSASPLLWYLHGSPGMGKTALLARFAHIAKQRGVPFASLDLTDVRALEGVAEKRLKRALSSMPPGLPGVLLVDGVESHGRLLSFYRKTLIPGLPRGLALVFASRRRPPSNWSRPGPTAREARIVQLQPLSPAQARELLDRMGLGPDAAESLLPHCHGHPATLCDSALLWRDGQHSLAPVVHQAHTALVARQDGAEDERYQEALRVCAVAGRLDRRLLAAALDAPDTAARFDWLASLSVARAHDGALRLEPVYQEAITHELRQNQPEAYAGLVLRIGRVLVDRYAAARGRGVRRRAFADYLAVLPGPAAPLVPPARVAPGGARTRAAVAVDSSAGLRLLDERWAARRPGAIGLLSTDDEQVLARLFAVDLNTTSRRELTRDPRVVAAWQHVLQLGRPARGRTVRLHSVSADLGGTSCPPGVDRVLVEYLLTRAYEDPKLVLGLLALPPPFWRACGELPPGLVSPVPDVRVDVDGVPFQLWCVDHRQTPPRERMHAVLGRSLVLPF